jgi:hypothetical protein
LENLMNATGIATDSRPAAANPRRRPTRRRPFPVTVTRTTPAPGPTLTPQQQARHRVADRIAGHLANAALYGRHTYPPGRDDHVSNVEFAAWYERIMREAPQVAATADPWAIRTARTPRGTLAVVRLHGPTWSLVLAAARPLSRPMLAVIDPPTPQDGDAYAASMLSRDWIPELARMNDAILTALDQRPA